MILVSGMMDTRKVKPCVKSEDSVKEYVRQTLRKYQVNNSEAKIYAFAWKD